MENNDKLAEIVCFAEGGVHKRLDEHRETVELLLSEAPHLFKEFPWIESWLKSQDGFLLELSNNVPSDKEGLMRFSRLRGSNFPRPNPIT